MVESFSASILMLKKEVEIGIVSMEHCNAIDNVCHDREDAPYNFFYLHMCMFMHMCVSPIDEFMMVVL